jgi:hypothetical protein
MEGPQRATVAAVRTPRAEATRLALESAITRDVATATESLTRRRSPAGALVGTGVFDEGGLALMPPRLP